MRHTVAVTFESGRGTVVVNGIDISKMTRRVEVTLDAMGEAVVLLDLSPDALTLDLGGVEVHAETIVTP
jgi:hypothetical protein